MNRRGFMVGLGGGAVLAPLCPVPPIGSGSAAVPPALAVPSVTVVLDGKGIADALARGIEEGRFPEIVSRLRK